MVNNSLIRPYFLGGGIGGVPLDSHDKIPNQNREARDLELRTSRLQSAQILDFGILSEPSVNYGTEAPKSCTWAGKSTI